MDHNISKAIGFHNIESVESDGNSISSISIKSGAVKIYGLECYEQEMNSAFRVDQRATYNIFVDSEEVRCSIGDLTTACELVLVHSIRNDTYIVQGIEIDEKIDSGFCSTKARDTRALVAIPEDWRIRKLPYMAKIVVCGTSTTISPVTTKEVFESWP
jgi:hypothetical protein